MSRPAQLALALAAAPAQALQLAPTDAEKAACRASQKGLCAACGGTSRHGHALDVVRRDGGLVALCRSHRLSWDGPWRCAKGAAKRRRSLKPRPRRPRQLQIGGPR